MRLFSWNVNGVRAIEKKGFLTWVDSTSPDILCIQETKANFDQLPESLQNIHGYHGYWHSGVRKGYSGVATFCKHEPLDIQYGLGIEKYDREGRVLITEFENFLLYNIYFPNGTATGSWKPRKVSRDGKLLQLNPWMEPLEKHREDLIVTGKLWTPRGNGHGAGTATWLTGGSYDGHKNDAGGISADQLVAKQFENARISCYNSHRR